MLLTVWRRIAFQCSSALKYMASCHHTFPYSCRNTRSGVMCAQANSFCSTIHNMRRMRFDACCTQTRALPHTSIGQYLIFPGKSTSETPIVPPINACSRQALRHMLESSSTAVRKAHEK
mmetsp:Transcript_55203/g.81071  ORF Transcript_55203/g.81071 Transcript_55203/m.81071 type:complete len:119 (-) Transcript_55203:216-572(-)